MTSEAASTPLAPILPDAPTTFDLHTNEVERSSPAGSIAASRLSGDKALEEGETQEGEDDSASGLVLEEKTMVEALSEEGNEKGGLNANHTKNASASSTSTHSLSKINAQEKPVGSALKTTWDPLQHSGDVEKGYSVDENQTQEITIVVDEGGIVDSTGKLLQPDVGSETNPSLAVSRRGSHLRLDLKPPSPQPWDLVDPPEENMKSALATGTAYSSAGSQKFRNMQNETHTRKLIPKSSYYFGPPPPDSAYGTPPMGEISVHHPREILRVERDYTGGEIIQFAPIYPLELENRLTPTQFLESINAINEQLIVAHSIRHAFWDNLVTTLSLQLSRLFVQTHFQKEMKRLRHLIDDLNVSLFNPVGLNILWPQEVAFLFLEIEYY